MDTLSLLPNPRSLALEDGNYTLKPNRRIVLSGGATQGLRRAGRRLQHALAKYADIQWELAASDLGPAEEIGATLRLAANSVAHEQGYTLDITPTGITITGSAPAGVFYGVCTLAQIVEQCGRELPALHIEDWPDFANRGLMLDISRDKVPTMATLYELIDMLAGFKINQFQLYTEHTFAYRQHPDVWANASPITGDEILALDAYCRERHVELVPNQNSFGHMHRWLKYPRYEHLAEVLGEFMTPWGDMRKGPFSLCPGDPGSLELVKGLYDELLPHFSSKQFNVGLDETFDLGQGRSKEDCEQRGTHRVYLDYLLKIQQEVAARGHVMQFWGDIIVQEPALIAELKGNIIALEWGYEAGHPFEEHGAHFAASGIPFYVCPGTSAWTSLAGRTDNALGNLLNAAENGLRHGAIGYLNTDWGDLGHWQVLPVSFLGYVAGAAYSWALDANRDLNMAAATGIHAFKDPTGKMGCVAAALGNVYQAPGKPPHNSSMLFWVLDRSFEELRRRNWNGAPTPDFAAALPAIESAMAPLGQAQIGRPDAALIVAEYENTARLMRHACHRAALLQAQEGEDTASARQALDDDMRDIIREYRRIWLARNRPGGLEDSVTRLEGARADYRDAS